MIEGIRGVAVERQTPWGRELLGEVRPRDLAADGRLRLGGRVWRVREVDARVGVVTVG